MGRLRMLRLRLLRLRLLRLRLLRLRLLRLRPLRLRLLRLRLVRVRLLRLRLTSSITPEAQLLKKHWVLLRLQDLARQMMLKRKVLQQSRNRSCCGCDGVRRRTTPLPPQQFFVCKCCKTNGFSNLLNDFLEVHEKSFFV